MTNQEPDLKSLDKRLKKARTQSDEQNKEEPPSSLGAAYRLGVELVVGVIVGAILGVGLDDLFGTKPIFTILMLFLGFGAGVKNVFREAGRMQAQIDAEEDAKD